ncbi:MAG: carboxypeptidase-like regulatory domain-containing protein [Actinomycetota bacterium]
MSASGRPGTMRRLAMALLTIIALASCAGAATPSGAAGVEGQVLASPQCPVETPTSPCPPKPWVGTVRATAEDGKTYEDLTDDQGRYEISLPPGTYVIVAVTEGGVPPTGEPQTVPVVEGQPLHLDLSVDTGIR